MQKTGSYIFLLTLLVHVSGLYLGTEMLEKVSKVLLIPILGFYFFTATKTLTFSFRKWILIALFFSWVGDILLMFVENDPSFFLAGLASFLIAHIFYIFFFHAVRVTEAIKPKALLLIPVVIYYAILVSILSPWLGDMKLPVRIYGVIICFMLMLAMHMLYIKNRKAGFQMAFGAFLFVISDSVLAINKFYYPFSEAGIIVMITYGIAQLLIIQGAIKYLRN